MRKKRRTSDATLFSDSSIKSSIKKRDGLVLPMAKARLIGPNVETSNQISRDDEQHAFVEAGALEPPYDPEMLCLVFEHSNALRQNIDSYATNIDGFGHSLVPVIDLDADDADERIAAAIVAESDRHVANDSDHVKKKRKELLTLMAGERGRADLFFEFCSQEISFVRLRRQTRQDLETMGNAYWEVLRNPDTTEIAEFVYVPGFTVRLLPQDRHLTSYTTKIKVSELSYEDVPKKKRFRRFVQIVEARVVFFKELGDPRVMSSKTGCVYETREELFAAEPDASPATELIHFRIHSPRSAYGIPRWIGTLLAVLGSRQAEEVNFLYFENKSVPPMAVLVSGGKLSGDSATRIENYVEAHIKGKKNFHKILVIEAEPTGGSSDPSAIARMRIQIVPLLGAQHSDAQFMGYVASNTDAVGGSFRLPRMLRGDIRDFNRSTADAAVLFAEMQVFEPERADFDFLMNRHILPQLGIRTWRFRSNSPVTRDPATMTEMVKNVVNANILTPAEGRVLLQDVFNRTFKKIKAPWVDQPMPMTLAGLGKLDGDDVPTNVPASPQDAAVPPRGGRGEPESNKALRRGAVNEALRLHALGKLMRHVEKNLAVTLQANGRATAIEEEIVTLPKDEFARLVGAA